MPWVCCPTFGSRPRFVNQPLLPLSSWADVLDTPLPVLTSPPACPLAQVPITLYFMTHAYFCLYHALSNLLIRRARAAVARYGTTAQVCALRCRRGVAGWRLRFRQRRCHDLSHRMQSAVLSSDRRLCLSAGPAHLPQAAVEAVVVFSLAYATAYGETLTIAHFPYYSFKARGASTLALLACCRGASVLYRLEQAPRPDKHNDPTHAFVQDRSRMYSVGSLFYAIYFFVSFPMFYRMDENPKVRCWRVRLQRLPAHASV